VRPGMQVVYISGFTGEDVIRRGMLVEGRPFLQKPFTPHDLARAVREGLDGEVAGRAALDAEPSPSPSL